MSIPKSSRVPFFYGWVIVSTAFLVFIVMSGVWSSFSIFYVALIDEFGWSRAETAGAFSVYMACQGLSAPVAGWLSDRFGPRRLMPVGAAILASGLVLASRLSEPWQLYLLYGAVIAFGQSCVGFIPHLRLISNWFDRKRGIAFGMATSGAGMGALILLPIIQYLVLHFGWRQAYLALAGLALLLGPLTWLIHRQHPSELGMLPDGDSPESQGETRPLLDGSAPAASSVVSLPLSPYTNFSLKRALSTPNLWAMFVSNVFFGIGTLVSVFQVAHIIGIGFEPMLAATISGLVGLLLAIGRLVGGIFCDRVGKVKTGVIGVSLISLGIVASLLAGPVQQTWLLFAFSLCFGFGWGFFGIVGATITAQLFRGTNYGSIAGFLEIGVGIGGFTGPWLGGYLFDQLGSYTIPFIIAVGAGWAGAACFRLAFSRLGGERSRVVLEEA